MEVLALTHIQFFQQRICLKVGNDRGRGNGGGTQVEEEELGSDGMKGRREKRSNAPVIDEL